MNNVIYMFLFCSNIEHIKYKWSYHNKDGKDILECVPKGEGSASCPHHLFVNHFDVRNLVDGAFAKTQQSRLICREINDCRWLRRDQAAINNRV